MSNNVLFYMQIGSIITYVGTIFFLYRLYIQQKDATIEQKGSTIELLKEKVSLLERQLEAAKNTSPDILLEQKHRRIELLEDEISRLAKDEQANRVEIDSKQTEIADLQAQIERTRAKLKELEAKVEECPFCNAPLVSMNPIELENEDDETYCGMQKVYICGHSNTDGELETLCPSDPRFPQLEDFEITTQYLEPLDCWRCSGKPKTYFANFITLMEYGKTEQESREKLINSYKRMVQVREERAARVKLLLENSKNINEL